MSTSPENRPRRKGNPPAPRAKPDSAMNREQVSGSDISVLDLLEPIQQGSRRRSKSRKTRVAVIMGSLSDLSVMEAALKILDRFLVPYHVEVISAHRTPTRVQEFAAGARDQGLRVLIAGAGGAAHLPGMVAAHTTIPVIGVPVPTRHLGGLDSLYSIVQMPAGVPVATVSIGGAENAALLALQILGNSDESIANMLRTFKEKLVERVEIMNVELSARLSSDASVDRSSQSPG